MHGGRTTQRASDEGLAPALTPTERSFVQGALAHLRAVCALTLPTAASYARMCDGIWSGGTYAAWGTYNREAPLRACGPRGHVHFEAKCVDATAAPHLAVAALLAGGLSGILDDAPLTVGDCSKAVVEMSAEERRALGLADAVRLPGTIAEAREALKGDAVMRRMLGEEFVEGYLGVNEVSGARAARGAREGCCADRRARPQTLERFMQGNDEKETVRKLIEYY